MTGPLPRISIIVPVYNEANTLPAMLRLLLSGLQPGDEVIVCDGQSEQDMRQVCRPFPQVNYLPCPARGRAVQMNYAAARARGQVLLFLHADTALPPGGLPAILQACRQQQVVGGCFRLRFDQPGWAYRCLAWFTRLNSPLWTFGDQAIFVRKTAFKRLGGYPEWPIMEDVALQRRLRRLGRFVKLPLAVRTSARRFRRQGVLRQFCLNLALTIAFFLGVHPKRIARFYRYSQA